MAGHSQFKNIMHRKGAQDAKKAKKFTKLAHEIISAVRVGGESVKFNPRLRKAIVDAKAINMPKDRIDTAINRGAGRFDGNDFEEIRYEGYIGSGIAVIVETLTDNKNRTASFVRSTFSKHGGNLGETGSVSFMFKKLGAVIFNNIDCDEEELLEHVLEIGGDDCNIGTEYLTIYCKPEQLNEVVNHENIDFFGDIIESLLIWLPESTLDISEDDSIKLIKLLDVLESNEDVQNIYHNIDLVMLNDIKYK